MTDQEKTQAKDEISLAIKHLEFILDLHGSHLEYREIAAVYPIIEQLHMLKFRYLNVQCYA